MAKQPARGLPKPSEVLWSQQQQQQQQQWELQAQQQAQQGQEWAAREGQRPEEGADEEAGAASPSKGTRRAIFSDDTADASDAGAMSSGGNARGDGMHRRQASTGSKSSVNRVNQPGPASGASPSRSCRSLLAGSGGGL